MNYKYKDFKHGQKCTCVIEHTKITNARISIDRDGGIFICQDEKNGSSTDNKLGYECSWAILSCGNFADGRSGVTDLKLLSKGRLAKEKPPIYIATYDKEGSDPYKTFTSTKELTDWLVEAHRDKKIIFDSIIISRLGKSFKPIVNVKLELKEIKWNKKN